MLYHVISLGCPKNTVDSERYSWVMEKAGWTLSPEPDEADLVILNTCAFIEPATEESLEQLHLLMDWKQAGTGRRLILAGCLPGRYPDDGSGGLEDIDLIIGPGDWRELAEWLSASCGSDALQQGSRVFRYLKVAEGCSNRCAYCTIPLIRGPFVPVPLERLLIEASDLARQGAREIGIVAQDTGSWSYRGKGIEDLLSRLLSEHPEIWFRLYYLHPAHFPRELPELMARFDNLAPYVDLPIQHAASGVLRRMGRGYGEREIRKILEWLDDSGLDIAVRYTVITGYPGETREEFHRLTGLLGDYSCGRHIVAFNWYPEEGTTEYERTIELGDFIDRAEAERRLALVSAVGESLYGNWDLRLSGRKLTVLAETPLEGHSPWDAPEVDVPVTFTRPVPPGEFTRVRILGSSGGGILAEPLGD